MKRIIMQLIDDATRIDTCLRFDFRHFNVSLYRILP